MKNIYYLFLLFSITAIAQHTGGTLIPNQKKTFRVESPTQTANVVNVVNETEETFVSGSTEVGETKGELSVSLSGGANYNIPFAVPPGVNGVEPHIGLVYSSQGENGIAGYGWSISGISEIRRIPSTKFHDNNIDAVDKDFSDRYALDGQRLVYKAGTTPVNSPPGRNYFETENFSNLKISSTYVIAGGSPTYFMVEYPDGTVARYDESDQEKYCITSWTNLQGLTIKYNYTKENNFSRISSITYGTKTGIAGYNVIEFVYENRTRPEESYINDSPAGLVIKNKILTAVKVIGNTNGFRNYYLEYDPAKTVYGFQRLTKITEKSGDNSKSYAPTVFTYMTTPSGITLGEMPTQISIGNVNNQAHQNITGDFNGDGKMDFILFPTTKDRYWVMNDIDNPSNMIVNYEVDEDFLEIFPVTFLNHENKLLPNQGWCLVTHSGMYHYFKYYAWTPEGIVSLYEKTTSALWDHNDSKKYLPGDFNGDGLTDVVVVSLAGNGTGLTNFVNTDRRVDTVTTVQLTITPSSRYYAADVNGDGKSDLLMFDSGKVSVYTLDDINKLTLLFAYNDANISLADTTTILLGDFNGDGKTDFIVPRGNGYHEYYKYSSTGFSFVKQTQYYDGVPYASSNGMTKRYYITTDYNNDGKTDLALLTCSRVLDGQPNAGNGNVFLTCLMNKNGSFSYTTGNYISAETGLRSDMHSYALPIFLSSEKANRKMEIGFIIDNKMFSFKNQEDFNKQKLLKTITTGNEVKETISYKSLDEEATNNYDNPNIYTPVQNPTEVYPNMDIKRSPSYMVVAKLEKKSETGYSKQFYTYHGAVYNFEGLGFLGFRSTMKTNWFNDSYQMISNVSRYDINLRGANVENFSALNLVSPAHSTTTNFITKSNYTYNTDPDNTFEQPLIASNKVYKLKRTKSQQFNKLENTSSITTTGYDIYNNPKKIETVIKNGALVEKVSTTTFNYDDQPTGTPYYVGRLINKNYNEIINRLQRDEDTNDTEEHYVYENHLLKQLRRNSNGSQFITEDYLYSTFGNLIQQKISAPGLTARVQNYEYDTATNRFLTKSIDIQGLATEYTYDPYRGNLLTEKDPYLNLTTYNYDLWGRRTAVIDFLNKTHTTLYSRVGNQTLITSTTADGLVTNALYDDMGNMVQEGMMNISGIWSYKSYLYDIYGRNYKHSEPYFNAPSEWNESKFDVYGRLIEERLFTGKKAEISYTGLETNIAELGKTKKSLRNALGNVISVVDEPGGEITYKYFANGNLKSTKYNNVTTTITQDTWGRKTELNDPSAGIYTYKYNLYGELTEESTPNGVTTYKIDDFGRLEYKSIAGNLTSSKATNVYDGTTKLLNSTLFEDFNALTQTNYNYHYDTKKRLWKTEESSPYAYFKRETSFDAFGRPLTELYHAKNSGLVSEKTVKNTYLNGHHWQITDATGAMLWQIDAVNEKGQLITAHYGNATGKETYTYEKGFPKTATFQTINGSYASATPFMVLTTNFNIEKSVLNNRKNTLFGILTVSEVFTHDSQNRLTSYPNPAVSGQLITQTYGASGIILNNNLGDYRYDDANKPYQNSAVKMTNPDVIAYYNGRTPQTISYNAFKRPVSISEQNKEKIDFEYNMFESRSIMYYGSLAVDKTLRPLRKVYSADGTMEIKLNITTGAKEFVTYIGGDGYSAPLVVKGDGITQNLLYLHRDYQGSILAITNVLGQVVEKRSFDPWGALVKYANINGSTTVPTTSDGLLLDRGYTGHEHLLGVALINMNGRLYDPKLHRFLSPDNNIQDPSNTQNFNRYGYVLNNPLSFTDPTGEEYNNPETGNDGSTWGMVGTVVSVIGAAWDNESFTEWRNKNFSWGSWFKNNSQAVGNWFQKNWRSLGDDLGLGSSRGVVMVPAGTYAFATHTSVSGPSSRGISAANGFNNGVEIHPYAATTSSGQRYGGDGSGSVMDYFSRFVYETDQYNPIALAWDGIEGFISGSDRYGNSLNKTESSVKLLSAIPITAVENVALKGSVNGYSAITRGGTIVKQTSKKADYLFTNRNDAMNWGRKQLGHSAEKMYDARGKWIGWSNSRGTVYWGHGDWGKGVGSSTFPHLNYNIDGVKGHLFLQNKITNRGMWDDFVNYFNK